MPNKNGLILITPSSIASTGTGNSSSINTNGSVTFSTCATLSLNGVFSADYDNYIVVMRTVWTGVGSGNLLMRMRLSGVDNSTASSYVYQRLNSLSTAVTASRTTTTEAFISGIASTQRDGLILNIYGPYLTQPTACRSITANSENSAAIFESAFTHNQSTAYDGFSLYTSASAMTGLICIYGMRK